MRRTRSQTRRSAFTLLELVLVMLVITIAIAVVAPTLRGWSRGSHLRDTAEQIVTLTRLARTQAASTAQLHRVTIDPRNRRCVLSVQDGQQFNDFTSAMDGVVEIPDGVTVQMTDLQNAPREFVDFFPNGRIDTGRVRVSMDDGSEIVVECGTPTEGFRITTTGGPR
jgi:type II secretion system protein H